MIELRWLHRSEIVQRLDDGASIGKTIRVLQCRYVTGLGEIIDGKPQGEFSEWQDVPEIQTGE